MSDSKTKNRVLVVFNTVCLYGMERSVIETFEVLRPDVEPIFIMNRANARHRTPLMSEMERSALPYRFFSDVRDWPRFGMPKSFKQIIGIATAIVKGNLDVLWEARHADALYLPIVTSAYLSVLAAAWLRLRGGKVIYFFHDLPSPHSTKLRLAVLFASDLAHNAQRSLALAAAADPFILHRRNSVIPPGIRLRQSNKTEGVSSRDRKTILFVGQVAPHKGVDLLIAAFSALAGKYSGIGLSIVGGVYEENRAWFDSFVAVSPHRDRIQHLGFRDDVREILTRAYVLAIPSRPSRIQESFCRVAAEAMAVGVPSVCFRSGALEEVVVHRETGLICEGESAESLAASLEELIRQPDLRDTYGRNARLRYERYYSADVVRRDWLKLLGLCAAA